MRNDKYTRQLPGFELHRNIWPTSSQKTVVISVDRRKQGNYKTVLQLHNQFSSRSLIDVLNKTGFCSSYKKVIRFETSASATNGVHVPGVTSSSSLQFVADNVDHNICTLDGYGTFHGFGIIAAVTPSVTEDVPIPRIKVSNDDVVSAGRINVHFYRP